MRARGIGVIDPGAALAALILAPSNAGDWYPPNTRAVGTRAAVLVVHGVAAGAQSCERCAPTTLADFTLVGDSYVAHRHGVLEGGASAHHCTTLHRYSSDLVVDAHDLGRYGVRDVRLDSPRFVCAP